MPQTIVVLGARNLGGAIVDHFSSSAGRRARWLKVRTRSTWSASAARWRCPPTHPIRLRSPAPWRTARKSSGHLTRSSTRSARARPTRPGPFGGGELAAADLEDFRGWTVAVAEQAFAFLSAGAAALKQSGGGALVQITGGSSARAYPGRGLWAAGAFATVRSCRPRRRSFARRGSTPRCWPSTRRSSRQRPPRHTRDQPLAKALADMPSVAARRWRTWSSRGRGAQTYEPAPSTPCSGIARCRQGTRAPASTAVARAASPELNSRTPINRRDVRDPEPAQEHDHTREASRRSRNRSTKPAT